MKAMLNVGILLIIIVLLGALGIILYMVNNLIVLAPSLSNSTYASTSIFGTNSTTIPGQNNSSFNHGATYSSNQLVEYTLGLINQERNLMGESNVTLAPTTSGQQHSNSMLQNDYFSHWDQYGMKPYMRYTLLNGNESVDENVAYNMQLNESCIASACTVHQINVTQAIYNMEYQMLFNDSACCNNGHRKNILDPNHNQISIGIAYNRTTVYLTEDFINDYIAWQQGTPTVVGNTIHLAGFTEENTNFSLVQVNYDSPPVNLSKDELAQTTSYDSGTTIAGVAANPSYYYQNVQTIYATSYKAGNGQFDTTFNLSTLFQSYGPGVYTLEVYLTNQTGGKFLGTTYSIFLNSSGDAYTPQNV